MKKLILLALFALPLLSQDPPKADATAYCPMPGNYSSEHCDCTKQLDEEGNAVGDLCSSEDPLPSRCAAKCGHARDCHCCASHK